MKRYSRQVSGSHGGLNLWLLQRASAIYMAIFLPLFLVYALVSGPFDYAAWQAVFVPLGMKVAVLLFVSALLLHAWIGLREIFIDYLHCLGCTLLRLAVYFTFAVLYLACLVWAVDILWSVK